VDLARCVGCGVDAANRVKVPASVALLAGGAFDMGSAEAFHPDDGEGPIRNQHVAPFAIDRHAVTNEHFAQFVAASGYVTEAERFGWSFVFYLFLGRGARNTLGVADAPWWRKVDRASWQRPEGRDSDIGWRADHPVVHVSWNDATAFAAWAGGRLPTEAEWEYAARGGLHRKRFPWGDEEPSDERALCNIWRGEFPQQSRDEWPGTMPVTAFEPNGYGLYNMAGNVWDWCADDRGSKGKAIRGGSYLCHRSYCYRYRVAARSTNAPDSSTGHMGFRLAYDNGRFEP